MLINKRNLYYYSVTLNASLKKIVFLIHYNLKYGKFNTFQTI
ncbi:hypothetical protein FPC831_720008 [Flavobacterium psychrophilum]|nr:hypothetical protein KU05112810_1590005 [Flavobacterium psychrophilum]SNB09915.1 hypothetical protein KU06062604_1610002 [Flavobacterium psychrophilum]SNB10876.1 hypothetical protein FPC831_720008 [Flavobacterium psychrophilum]SNB18002.1 hypothetical protein KU06112801_600002 [Flavobacterium psychrophilum]SNB97512.1 hypothetical protein FPC840_560008 [Flavobacterium psychrophilum]